MSVEMHPAHPCDHVPCKCPVPEGKHCCSDYCEHDVEQSEQTGRCGCGHTACDTTSQMGNEETFEPGS